MKFSAAILALTAEVAHADFFRNDFLPVGHVRTDAIINPDCLSDHVHTFYGAPLLYPQVTFEDLRNSDPTLSSGNIEENNSLYWHPAVYQVAANGKKTLQESEMTTVYYNWVPGQTTAFPPGFRMITPGEEVFSEGITSGESEMELSISFQSCWDGVNLDSPDHKSHVAFPEGEGDNSPCPSSHPVRIPRLDFFIRWFDTNAAKWEFADGSKIFHADYVSGWDESFLQELLDGGDGDVDSKVTFRAGILHQGADSELIQQLNDNAVPQVDTSCITTETIDNIVNLPRGACTGTLISPIGVCGGPPPTPPITTAPVTAAPITTAPVTAAPISTAPITTAPVTASPVTAAPVTAAPISTAPVTTAPVTAAPITAAPISTAPVTAAPVTDAPVTAAPITAAPISTAPVTAAPVTAAPVTAAPISSAPISSAPVTAAPITAATPTPTTPSPTIFYECENSWFDFRVRINGNWRWKHCGWAENSKAYRCGLDPVVSTMCPETCGTCNECVDSAGEFRFDYEGDLTRSTCDWVANHAEPEAVCEVDGVALACRVTCGLC